MIKSEAQSVKVSHIESHDMSHGPVFSISMVILKGSSTVTLDVLMSVISILRSGDAFKTI
jgi:hypothetical protein